MTWFDRMMTGRGNYRDFVEFSVSPQELQNPGGLKALFSHYQQIIPGGANLVDRGAVFGQLGINWGQRIVVVTVPVAAGGVLAYKVYPVLNKK